VRNAGYAEFTASDRIGFAANPAFDASTMEVWGALLNGGAAVVIDQDDLLDANRFRTVLARHAISMLFLPVGLFNQHAHAFGDELRQLRNLMVGGDALDPRRIAHVMATCPPRMLTNGYGPTETTTFAMFHPITDVPNPELPIPLGRPLANTQVYILDAHGRPCPIGVTGEIHIGGDGLALGYLNRPELTAERFIPSPFAAGQRLYKTGDLGRRDEDGTIAFLGRNDFQVKLRGFRIELGEIEAALTRQAGVGQAVVIVRGDAAEERQIVAYYTATEAPHVVNPTTLRAGLSAELPAHHIPSAFVVMDAFPLTPNGKLDRKGLPAPDAGALASAEYAEPQGPAEQAIAAIVADILELDRVGRHDNFFELGGTSLMIVGFMQRLTRAGYPVDLQTITTSATIADLAEAIAARSRETN
jgi:acyl-coenzyme A synthetase/AMP-(fatty) acid ligase/aryl carrier-like protein